jgi:acyl dehydratase
MAGLYVEQFEIDRVFEHEIRRTVTEADNVWFCAATFDPARTVLEKRNSQSRPGAGIVTFRHEGVNQGDEIVCRCTRQALMLRKPAG